MRPPEQMRAPKSAPTASSRTALLISHSHLDHVAGLAHVSPDLGGFRHQKLLFGTEATIEAIKSSIFNNLVWPNLSTEPPLAPWAGGAAGGSIVNGSEAQASIIYWRLSAGTMDLPLSRTDMCVAGVAAVTHTVPSTGFLIGTPRELPSSFLAYFGDIGPDGGATMEQIKAEVKALFDPRCHELSRPGALRALMLECSYIDGRLDGALYGHLTPLLVTELLKAIRESCGGRLLTQDTHLVVTHTKPTWGVIGESGYEPLAVKQAVEWRRQGLLPRQVIRRQLEQHLEPMLGKEWLSTRLHVAGGGMAEQGSVLRV